MPKLSLNASKKTKHTPAGEIPVDWAWATLDGVTSKERRVSYGIVQTGENLAEGIPCVRVVDLNNSRLDLESMIRTSPRISNSYKRTVLKKDDIIFALRGDIGKTIIVDEKLVGANLTRGVALIAADPAKAQPEFLRYSLEAGPTNTAIRLAVNGTSLKEIPINALRQIPVPLPPLPEQRQIADILSTWNRAIETLESLIAAKSRRKQALMQQLLTHTLEFAKVGHSRHRLGDVVERVTRKNPKGDTNVLTISAQQGLISQSSYFNRNVAGEDLSTYYQLKRGEFAYNRSSSKGYPFGAIKRLNAYPTGVVSTLYLCFRITEEKRTCSDFLCHCFDSGMLNQGLRCVAQEGARAHGLLNVTSTDFMDLDVCLPDFASQQRIATILNTADRELTLHRQHLEFLRTQKRGLMQKLLTGEVRTIR